MKPTWFQGPGGWWLTPEGGVIHPATNSAVIADLHLGYEWARGNGGDCVPAHSLSETIDKLQSLLDGSEIRRLIVAGDLVESRRSCRRTDGDVATLTRWFKDRCVEFEPLAGNHDPPRGPARLLSMTVDGWTITHGDRPIKVRKTITGHLHPMLRARGHSAPCFLVGESSIVLPAFSRNAAGVDVQTMLGRAFRCVASTGEELLDFGPLVDLAKFFR